MEGAFLAYQEDNPSLHLDRPRKFRDDDASLLDAPNMNNNSNNDNKSRKTMGRSKGAGSTRSLFSWTSTALPSEQPQQQRQQQRPPSRSNSRSPMRSRRRHQQRPSSSSHGSATTSSSASPNRKTTTTTTTTSMASLVMPPSMKRPSMRSNNTHANHDESDDLSEVTVDTAIRHIPAAHASSENWMEQMAALKLELANVKADHDRLQWKCQRLQQHKESSEKTILALRDENKFLTKSLKDMERKYLRKTMESTTSTATAAAATTTTTSSTFHALHHNNANHDGGTIEGSVVASSTTSGATPYRTFFHEEEEDEYEFDDYEEEEMMEDKTSWTPPAAVLRDDRSQTTRSSGGATLSVTQRTTHRSPMRPKNGSVVEFSTSSSSAAGVANDDVLRTTDDPAGPADQPSDLVDIDVNQDSFKLPDSKSLSTAMTDGTSRDESVLKERYPADDPFSTLNDESEEGTREQENRNSKIWWTPQWAR